MISQRRDRTEGKHAANNLNFYVTRFALLASFPRATQNFPASAVAGFYKKNMGKRRFDRTKMVFLKTWRF
jgi:hypothetical protein